MSFLFISYDFWQGVRMICVPQGEGSHDWICLMEYFARVIYGDDRVRQNQGNARTTTVAGGKTRLTEVIKGLESPKKKCTLRLELKTLRYSGR